MMFYVMMYVMICYASVCIYNYIYIYIYIFVYASYSNMFSYVEVFADVRESTWLHNVPQGESRRKPADPEIWKCRKLQKARNPQIQGSRNLEIFRDP